MQNNVFDFAYNLETHFKKAIGRCQFIFGMPGIILCNAVVAGRGTILFVSFRQIGYTLGALWVPRGVEN